MEGEGDETFYRNVDLEENTKKQLKLEEEDEEDEEDGGGQALNFKNDEIIEIPDDDNIQLAQNDLALDDDEEGIENVNEGKSFVIKTKDGKTTMIFSGEQQDMAKEVTKNIRKKYEQSKKTEIVDFKVISNKKRYK